MFSRNWPGEVIVYVENMLFILVFALCSFLKENTDF